MMKIDLGKITVVVGLSGGVDSSVAALLLKRAGFNVRGVYLKCYWTYEGCQSDQDRASAARVASELDIPFEVWDFEKEYRKTVIDYFYDEYKKGRTPNPDVVCNREIKFGLFLRQALNHKSQITNNKQNSNPKNQSDSLEIKDAKILKQVQDDVSTSVQDDVSTSVQDDVSTSVQDDVSTSVQDDGDKDLDPGSPSGMTMEAEIATGRTPRNDDNSTYIATGHYARIGLRIKNSELRIKKEVEEIIFPKFSQEEKVSDGEGIRYVGIGEFLQMTNDKFTNNKFRAGNGGKYNLYGGVDEKKDQSYFLYDIASSAIEHILFPLGNLTKIQVRQIAKEANLSTFSRPDSSGICFIGEVNVEKFLKERIKEHEGNVVTKSGQIIGKHKGVEFYTIGQRHGFNISPRVSAETAAVSDGKETVGALSLAHAADYRYQHLTLRTPYYVINKNLKKNELVVGMGEECKTDQFIVKIDRNLKFEILNLQGDSSGRTSQNDENNIYVRIRNLGEFIPCQLKMESGKWQVNLGYPVFGVAPGQSAVFYRKFSIFNFQFSIYEVVGGGVIEG